MNYYFDIFVQKRDDFTGGLKIYEVFYHFTKDSNKKSIDKKIYIYSNIIKNRNGDII